MGTNAIADCFEIRPRSTGASLGSSIFIERSQEEEQEEELESEPEGGGYN